jgi:hypothetical protein
MSARGPRFEATQSNSLYYWTGVPCKHGHISFRITLTGTCMDCRRERDRMKYATNPEIAILKRKKYYEQNAELIKLKRRQSYKLNSKHEKVIARKRSELWRLNNPEKVKQQKSIKLAYKRANSQKSAALLAKRRAAQKRRTPCWLTKDDFWLIEEAYDLAAKRSKLTKFSWHVDHIIPLQGKQVSGLHVPWNLQVIPWFENLSKSNKLPADVVAALGNGSNKAGADKLYEMMHNIRREHRKGKPEDLPKPAKSPLQYIKRRA